MTKVSRIPALIHGRPLQRVGWEAWFVLALSLSGCGLPSTSTPTTTAPPDPGTGDLQTVTVYMLALEDEGKSGQAVGCGDSAVPVEMQIPAGQEPLQAALEALFSIRQSQYDRYYNALYQSSLQVERIEVDTQQVKVFLTGSLISGGVCDDPRILAQLDQTVRKAAGVAEGAIFINDRPLEDWFSQK